MTTDASTFAPLRAARRLCAAIGFLCALLVTAAPTVAQQNAGGEGTGDGQGAAAEKPEESAGKPGEEAGDETSKDEQEADDEQEGASSESSSSKAGQPAEEELEAEPPQSERKRQEKIQAALRRQIRSGQRAVPIYQIVEEMVDEAVIDIRDLEMRAISPAAIRKMGLTPNLSDAFGEVVEATLVNALANDTDVTIKRCAKCQSLRSRIEDGDWVVSLGMTRQKQLREEAKRLGVKTFLDARFSFYPAANIAALNLEFVRARDGKVMWSETYRSDSTTAAILRSGDRELSRRERVDELERKIEERPYYGFTARLGVTHIPYDAPQGGISGFAPGVILYEEWGPQRRWRYGIGGEAFVNLPPDPLVGGFLGATIQYDIFEPDLNWPTVRTGPTVAGFFAGQEGNSAAFRWGVDVIMQFRLGAGFGLMYFVPTTFLGSDLGGFSYNARVSFNW